MKKHNRPIVSKGSPVVPMFAALTMLTFGIYTVPLLLEALKTGQTYSLAVVFADAAKISRSNSPEAFWINLGMQMFGCLAMIILSIIVFFGAIIDCKRRAAEKKRLNQVGQK